MSADEKVLGAMHDKLAEVMKDILANGEETVTNQGEVVRVKPKAATLNVIRQFLKDNGIDCAKRPNSPAQSLAEQLPEFADEGVPDDETDRSSVH